MRAGCCPADDWLLEIRSACRQNGAPRLCQPCNHLSPVLQHGTIMNYLGAKGLEFGGGNTKVDPSVAAGKS